MTEQAHRLLSPLRDAVQLHRFAAGLAEWLVIDLMRDRPTGETLAVRQPAGGDFPESRARALLRAVEVLDEPTRHAFERLIASPDAVRLALFDLLVDSGLAAVPEVVAAGAGAAAGDEAPDSVPWLTLIVAAAAWKRQYPLFNLDPAAPPASQSPAGQLLREAAQFVRRQVQRSATERDRLLRQLARPAGDDAPSLDELTEGTPIAPVPPHFRSPVPVRYPEYARDPIAVDEDELTPTSPPVTRGDPLVITESDIAAAEPEPPTLQPPVTISRDQVAPPPPPSPLPSSGVILPGSAGGSPVQARPSMLMALRERFGGQQEMKATRLRVVVQQKPDGPGLYGLQVRVSCPGIRSTVAGTTDRQGRFLAELPVPVDSGLTYDVDVTWPRDYGGDVERKSISLHADRTEFTLPFYRHHGT